MYKYVFFDSHVFEWYVCHSQFICFLITTKHPVKKHFEGLEGIAT